MSNKTINLQRIKRELRGETRSEEASSPENEAPEAEEFIHPDELEKHMTEPSLGSAMLSWEAPEFEFSMAKSLRLMLFGMLLLAFTVAAAVFKNFPLAALLAIAGGLSIAYAVKAPRTLKLAVTSKGVKAERKLYLFEDLKSFWIFYDPPLTKELSLHSQRALMPMLRLPLGDLDPLRLREILLRFLKEEKHEESLSDVISKVIGF